MKLHFLLHDLSKNLRDKGFIDDKIEVGCEKHLLVDEMKLKMAAVAEFTFSILALPPGVLFKSDFTFVIYGPFVKKASLRFLKGGVLIAISNQM